MSFSYPVFMKIIALLSQLPSLIQLSKLLIIKNATSLSLQAYICAGLINMVWLVHGIKIKDTTLILGNAVGFIINLSLMIGILVY
jgi:uncharacterized protein with PQ loop repeat